MVQEMIQVQAIRSLNDLFGGTSMRNDLPEKDRRVGQERRSQGDRRQFCDPGYTDDDERRKNQDKRLLEERRVLIAVDRHFALV